MTHELSPSGSNIRCMSFIFLDDGKYCLTGGHDRTVRLWNPSRMDPASPIPPHNPQQSTSVDQLPHCLGIQTYHEGITHPVNSLATDGEQTLLTASDKTLIVHDLVTAKYIRRFTHHHSQRINAVEMGPFQESFLTASYDATVSIWDARSNNTRTPIQTLSDAKDSVTDVHIDSTTHHLLRTSSVDGYVRTYDIRQGILHKDHLGGVSLVSMAQSPDGTCLAVHGLEDATIRVLDAPSGKLLQTLSGQFTSGNYALQSAFVNDSLVVTGSENGTATIFNTVTAEPVVALEYQSSLAPVCAVDAAPGMVITGGYDGHAIVWGHADTLTEDGSLQNRAHNTKSGRSGQHHSMSFLTLLAVTNMAILTMAIPSQALMVPRTAKIDFAHGTTQSTTFFSPSRMLSHSTSLFANTMESTLMDGVVSPSSPLPLQSSSFARSKIDDTWSWISQSCNFLKQQIDVDVTLVVEIATVLAVGVLASKAKQYLILDLMRIDDPDRMGRIGLLDKFVDLIILFLASIFILDALDIGGLSMESLFAAGGIGALTFSLASKSLAEQVVGGLVIAAWDVFQEGDDIVLLEMGIAGTVKKIGLADTAILNGDNVLVKVPNSQIFNQHVSNLSRVQITPVRQTLRFKYADLDKIPKLTEDIKREMLRKCGEKIVVTDGSKPFRVNLNEFKADHVEVSVLVHLQAPPGSEKYFDNRQAVLEAIAAAAKHNQMEFAIPAMSYTTDGTANLPPLDNEPSSEF